MNIVGNVLLFCPQDKEKFPTSVFSLIPSSKGCVYPPRSFSYDDDDPSVLAVGAVVVVDDSAVPVAVLSSAA